MALGIPVIGGIATGVNASVSPTLPPSPAVGDLLLLAASIRNAGAGSPDTPAGWTVLLDGGNVKLFGKYMEASTVAPTVTFTGGVANADTQAGIMKVPGAAMNQLAEFTATAVQSNASAQNIAYPALDVPGPGQLVLIVSWKQDDATTIAAPAGFTGVLNSLVTAGDDASLRVVYQLQSPNVADADVAAGSLVVTGGASAISKAAVIAFMPAATFQVTIQDAQYPPRAALAVSGLAGSEFIDLYRVAGGVRTAVRGGQITAGLADTAFVRIDAELPFGVPVRWEADINGATYVSQTETITLPGGKVALTDAISGLAAEAVIVTWPEKTLERRVSVFQLASGATKTISGPPAQFTGRLEMFTETDTDREQLKELLDNATSNIILIRQPGGYSDVDSYVSVIDFAIRRYSQDGTDQRRIFALNVAEVNGWASTFEAAGYTYADLAALYAGLTYADLAGDFATYLALAVSELE